MRLVRRGGSFSDSVTSGRRAHQPIGTAQPPSSMALPRVGRENLPDRAGGSRREPEGAGGSRREPEVIRRRRDSGSVSPGDSVGARQTGAGDLPLLLPRVAVGNIHGDK